MKDTMDKKPKKIKSKKCQFEPTLEFYLFYGEISQLFFQFHVPGVPEWKIAHIEWSKKAQNTGKSPKNDCVTSLRNLQDVCEHPVDAFY